MYWGYFPVYRLSLALLSSFHCEFLQVVQCISVCNHKRAVHLSQSRHSNTCMIHNDSIIMTLFLGCFILDRTMSHYTTVLALFPGHGCIHIAPICGLLLDRNRTKKRMAGRLRSKLWSHALFETTASALDSTCCSVLCSEAPRAYTQSAKVVCFRSLNYLSEKYLFLENYVTSEGAVSHHVLYHQQLSIIRYQVRFHANN